MDSITDFFGAGWVGSLLGLIGIALAIIFYLRSRVRPQIAFQTDGVQLIGGTGALPPEVEVRFRAKKVAQLARTHRKTRRCADRG